MQTEDIRIPFSEVSVGGVFVDENWRTGIKRSLGADPKAVNLADGSDMFMNDDHLVIVFDSARVELIG